MLFWEDFSQNFIYFDLDQNHFPDPLKFSGEGILLNTAELAPARRDLCFQIYISASEILF